MIDNATAATETWPARVNMPSYEVKDMAVHEVAPIQMPTSGLYHLKSVSAALHENLKYPTSNHDHVQNNWREQPVCTICTIFVILNILLKNLKTLLHFDIILKKISTT